MFSLGSIGHLYSIIFRVLKPAGFREGMEGKKGIRYGIEKQGQYT